MSTVPAVPVNYELLSELTGQQNIGPKVPILPRLVVNKDVGEDPDNPQPVGVFLIETEGKKIFGKTVTFRPYAHRYQYQRYDSAAQKFLGKSTMVSSLRDEAMDTMGTSKCGKIAKAKQGGLTPEALAVQKEITVKQNIFGTISIGKDVVDLPIVWKIGGKSLFIAGEKIEELSRQKYPLPMFNWEVKLFREKTGSNIYYLPTIEYDVTKQLPIDDKVMETFKVFGAIIKSENDYVLSVYNKIKNGVREDNRNQAVIDALSLNDDISDL